MRCNEKVKSKEKGESRVQARDGQRGKREVKKEQ
jgi:hypothetical protein